MDGPEKEDHRGNIVADFPRPSIVWDFICMDVTKAEREEQEKVKGTAVAGD